ncbi:hypothetical protein [Pseudonocardia alni]|uniref:hypothetical protein n=1 Tax=Pseudonocardia alni TaxID=33907 RepID=UPI0027A4F5A0|nr:hypothetical protein PaSha_28770 [Pseudonocardia alni]
MIRVGYCSRSNAPIRPTTLPRFSTESQTWYIQSSKPAPEPSGSSSQRSVGIWRRSVPSPVYSSRGSVEMTEAMKLHDAHSAIAWVARSGPTATPGPAGPIPRARRRTSPMS